MTRAALITGSSGGIGQALALRFADEGYKVIGLDQRPLAGQNYEFVESDLVRLCRDEGYRQAVLSRLRACLPQGQLQVLVNNAALQIVAPTGALDLADWDRIMAVNLTAPFLLVQGLLAELERAGGSVINISSIHEQLTKPGFAAYASSKAGLTGLTRALAVDLGGRVRVNAIAPAAIETEMLKAGFAANPDKLEELRSYHPGGVIGQPAEVADLAVFIASEKNRFLNGSVVRLDGAISSRLHDPV